MRSVGSCGLLPVFFIAAFCQASGLRAAETRAWNQRLARKLIPRWQTVQDELKQIDVDLAFLPHIPIEDSGGTGGLSTFFLSAAMGRKTFDIGVQKGDGHQTVSVCYQDMELACATVAPGKLWLKLETSGELPLPLMLRKKTKAAQGTPAYQAKDLDRWDGCVTGQFSYSTDGNHFIRLGDPFEVQSGMWIGARLGLYCLKSEVSSLGRMEVDRIEIYMRGVE